MRLDARDEIGGGRLLDRQVETCSIGAPRQLRRADGEIERDADDGNGGRRVDDRRDVHARWTLAQPCRALLFFGALDETAGELDARALRFGAAEQTLRPLGFDLGELIAIDGELAIVSRNRTVASRRQQRARHRPHDGCRQQCKTHPQDHAAIQASPRGWNRARCARLTSLGRRGKISAAAQDEGGLRRRVSKVSQATLRPAAARRHFAKFRRDCGRRCRACVRGRPSI